MSPQVSTLCYGKVRRRSDDIRNIPSLHTRRRGQHRCMIYIDLAVIVPIQPDVLNVNIIFNTRHTSLSDGSALCNSKLHT